MINKVSISNFKSIYKLDIELGRVNVFIGENGCGKSNILEAVAMAAASNGDELDKEELINKGVRVTKPSLLFNSFLGIANRSEIKIELWDGPILFESILKCDQPDDVFAAWKDDNNYDRALRNFTKIALEQTPIEDPLYQEALNQLNSNPQFKFQFEYSLKRRSYSPYLIYNINTSALRGIINESIKQPLGINGERLDILLSTFTKEQLQELKDSNFISWLKDFDVEPNDKLKANGFKFGRDTSKLYLSDKYMQKNNNRFPAENANEGALHVLFYLALFISEKTPSFFAIDNIETALNPLLCRQLMTRITELSKTHNKQVLITTHNPAVLDGLNLYDPEQHLFVVKRTDEGHTKVERINLKPNVENGSLKLSDLWMRGYLGALPSNIF